MTDSTSTRQAGDTASVARPGKRERLVAAASDLVYRQGVARTTLADLAAAADVPLGNVYYYFKTKEDIVAAIVQVRVEELESRLVELERRHRSPKARLKALVGMQAEHRDVTSQYGCPYGTLSSELSKRAEGSDPLAGPLMRIQIDWAEQQLDAMGRRDAHDLAVELVASYEGITVLTSTLGQPELMARHLRRLQRWIEAIDT